MNKFAVLIKQSVHIPGDERSQTHPGHGYPAHTMEYESLKEFKNKEEFVAWIQSNDKRTYPEKYRAITFSDITISKTINFEIK